MKTPVAILISKALSSVLRSLAPPALVALVALAGLLSTLRGGHRPSHETRAIEGLKALRAGQALYRAEFGGYAPDLDALAALDRPDLVHPTLLQGVSCGYRYRIEASARGWIATSDPIIPGTTGDRSFGIDQRGRIVFSCAGPVRFNPDGSSPERVLGE